MAQETIQIIYQPLGSLPGLPSYYHETIVYTTATGQKYYMSAGPTIQAAPTAANVSQASDAVGQASSASPFGQLVTFAGNVADLTAAQQAHLFGPPSQPYDSVAVSTGSDLSGQWNKIVQAGNEINTKDYAYSPVTQNSNSCANTELEAAGITPPFFNGPESSHWTPAADVNLLPGEVPSLFGNLVNQVVQSGAALLDTISDYLPNGTKIDSISTDLSGSTTTLSFDENGDGIADLVDTSTTSANGTSTDDVKYLTSTGNSTVAEAFYSNDSQANILSDTLNFRNGLSELDLFQTPGYSEQTFFYSGPSDTGADLKNVFDLSNGVSEEQLFFGLPAGYKQEDLIYSGQNLTGTHLLDIYDANNGTSAEELYSIPSYETSQIDLFSGPDGTGINTEDVIDFSPTSTIQSQIQLFNPSSSISEEIENFSGTNGSGTNTSDAFNYTNGTSEFEFFPVNAINGATAVYQWFSGPNETGTYTNDLIDYSNGISEQDLFSGIPGYNEKSYYYSGPNAGGLDLKNVFNLSNGVSEEQLFYGLPGGYTQEDLIYNGQNLTGSHLLDIYDASNGTSAEALYSGLPSGASSETLLYSGRDGSGSDTENVIDFTGGGSQIQLFNPESGVSEEIEYFGGLNGGGANLGNTLDFTDGTSQVQTFAARGLPNGITSEYENFSGTNGTGTDTRNVIDYSNGLSEVDLFTGIPGYNEQSYFYSSPNATGADLKNIFNLTNGESEEQLFVGVPSGYKQEDLVFSGQNLSGTDLLDIYDSNSGGSAEVLHSGLPSGTTSEDILFSGPDGTGSETESVQDLQFGGSIINLFNPSSSISREIEDFSGANGGGTNTQNTIDFDNNSSEIQNFVGLPNTVTEEDKYYTGLGGTGYQTSETIDQSYGAVVGVVDKYNSSGALIEEDETAYDFGRVIGYSDYNLVTNQVTYEQINNNGVLEPSLFDPGYSAANNSFNASTLIIDPSNLSYLGCGGTTIDSDGDFDNDPLLLSLDRQGINLIPIGNVLFDFTGTGQKTPTGWMGSDTGMLVLDGDGNGVSGNGTSIIKGFGPLASLDSNGDGVIDKNDSAFSRIEVWADSNTNGTIDPGELLTLQSLGIQSISLANSPANETVAGNSIVGTGAITYTDGTTGPLEDVVFASQSPDQGSPASVSSTTDLLRQYIASSFVPAGPGIGNSFLADAASNSVTTAGQLVQPHPS